MAVLTLMRKRASGFWRKDSDGFRGSIRLCWKEGSCSNSLCGCGSNGKVNLVCSSCLKSKSREDGV